MKNQITASINSHNVNLPIRKSKIKRQLYNMGKSWQLYLLIMPVIIYFIIFHYLPMYGVVIAFKNYIPVRGIWDSPWVGIIHFKRFFNSYYFSRLMVNTIGISIYHLVVGFPIPIILALLINEVKSKYFKKTVQMVTYAPHFISVVVLVGMLMVFSSPTNGIFNNFIRFFGGEPIAFMEEPVLFKSIFVFSGIWQNAGWGTIIYLAALSAVDFQIHEAAIIDGASKLQRVLHINIPSIMPTAVVLLILAVGGLMNVGFEKVFLMQNELNRSASDVISTYVYRNGILGAKFSFSAAVGLFNSLINFAMLITVNKISRKVSDSSLW